MGTTSEREFMKKICKMREKISKKSHNIRKEFINLEKTKANLLKKTEEERNNFERDSIKWKAKYIAQKISLLNQKEGYMQKLIH